METCVLNLRTFLKCVILMHSAFIYGKVGFLGYTLSYPLFVDSIKGAVILYFVLHSSTFHIHYLVFFY